LLAALARASAIEPDVPQWEARFDRPERELRPAAALLPDLIEGLGRAVEAAVDDARVGQPFVVDWLGGESNEDARGLPGFIRVGSRAFRDEMRQFGSTGLDALTLLWKGEDEGTVVRRSVRDFCDDETLRACREINTALDVGRDFDDPDRARAAEVLEQAVHGLWRRLNTRAQWPGATDPFLVLVRIDPYGGDDWQEQASSALGAEVVTRFEESIRHRTEAEGGDDVDLAAVRADRDELEAWLRRRGLDVKAHELAHDVAEIGLRLVAADGPARSRLGGPALLPPGEPWPHAEGDRPLSFLAALDLTEFGDDRLPAQGWLLFFLDIDDQGEALGFIGEPTPNAPGAMARVFHVPPGVEPVEAPVPEKLRGDPFLDLRHRPVVARRELTLPHDYEVGSTFGLSAARAEALEDIAMTLRSGDSAWNAGDDHWVLGHATGVQGHPAEEGTALLLHLGWDEELGFEFQDGGAVQFRIPRDALAAGDWSQVVAEGDSG
jgi:hypothetical protein